MPFRAGFARERREETIGCLSRSQKVKSDLVLSVDKRVKIRESAPKLQTGLRRETDVLVNPFRCKLGWTDCVNNFNSYWAHSDPNA